MRNVNIGATGEFPDGKIHNDDKGGLMFRVGHDREYVHIEFGTSVQSMSMLPAEAIAFGKLLIKLASRIK